MTDRPRRPPAAAPLLAISLLFAASLLPGLVAPASAGPVAPSGIDTFLRALGQVESGGRYTARNASSGAYGKYQILPSSWRAWTRHYLHDATAWPTPHNQEAIARARVTDLYRSFGRWNAVAHWWLTGRAITDPRSQTSGARHYVQKVMTVYARFADGGEGDPAVAPDAAAAVPEPVIVTYDDRSSLTTYTGAWHEAGQRAYVGSTATYATAAGASVVFPFVGRSIAWLGPVGPTRGEARVSVDGEFVATIDLHRPAFRPSLPLFRHAWTEAGRHWIMVEVVGTAGHPNVTIDAFVVGR